MSITPESLAWLRQQLTEQYGADSDAVWNGLHQKRITSLRVNTLNTTLDAIIRELNQNGLTPEPVGFFDQALTLPHSSEKTLRELDIYKNGCIYLQSLSSMIPPLLLDPQPGEDILDMCAAPGGKTSEIVQLTNNKAMVTACEPDRIRCDRLRSNLKKLGCERVNVMNKDARKLDSFLKFDRILLDAPCSGSGTLDLSESEKNHFSQKLVMNSARLQGELLKKACEMLKPGGRLVYSTCSLLRQENDAQTAAALRGGKMRAVSIDMDLLQDIPALKTSLPGTVTVLPSERFEGFYISVFEKVG